MIYPAYSFQEGLIVLAITIAVIPAIGGAMLLIGSKIARIPGLNYFRCWRAYFAAYATASIGTTVILAFMPRELVWRTITAWSVVIGAIGVHITIVPAVLKTQYARALLAHSLAILLTSSVLAVLLMIPFGIARSRALEALADSHTVSLQRAISDFHDEYGHFPGIDNRGDWKIRTDGSEGAQLLKVLLGLESKENPKKIRFFEAPEATNMCGGIQYSPPRGPGRYYVEGLFDPWGGPYYVVFDGDYDNKIDDPRGGPPIHGARVIVYSLGKNGQIDNSGSDDAWAF